MSKTYKPIGGRRGPQKKSVQQKILEGNRGHQKLNMFALTVPTIEDAQCPPEWPPSAQRSFVKLKPAAEATKTINKNNIGAFQTLCLLDGIVDDAARFATMCIAERGPAWMIAKYGGFIGTSPAVKMIWDAARNAKPYYDAFGMTPSSVQDVVKGALDDAKDPLDDL